MNPIAPSRTFSRRFRTRSTSELISKFFLDAQYVTGPPTIVPDRLAEAVIAGMNQAELPINDLSQSAPNQYIATRQEACLTAYRGDTLPSCHTRRRSRDEPSARARRPVRRHRDHHRAGKGTRVVQQDHRSPIHPNSPPGHLLSARHPQGRGPRDFYRGRPTTRQRADVSRGHNHQGHLPLAAIRGRDDRNLRGCGAIGRAGRPGGGDSVLRTFQRAVGRRRNCPASKQDLTGALVSGLPDVDQRFPGMPDDRPRRLPRPARQGLRHANPLRPHGVWTSGGQRSQVHE